MKKKKIANMRKIINLVFIFIFIFSNFSPIAFVSAASTTLPTAQDLASLQTLSGVSPNVTTSSSSIGADADSAKSKLKGPTLDISFGAEGELKSGTKVLATAIPSGFSNASNKEKLYFTWYLKRKGCDLKSGNKNCDLDGDGHVTVNDWKIEASRIIIKGTFDASSADYEKNSYGNDIKSSSGEYAIPAVSDNNGESWNKSYDPNEKNGDNAPNCYVQDPEKGDFYELRGGGDLFSICPQGYHRACLRDTVKNCNFIENNESNAEDGVPYYQDPSVTDSSALTGKNLASYNSPIKLDQNASIKNFTVCQVEQEEIGTGNTTNESNPMPTKSDMLSCEFKQDVAIADIKDYAGTETKCVNGGLPACVPDSVDTVKQPDVSGKTIGSQIIPGNTATDMPDTLWQFFTSSAKISPSVDQYGFSTVSFDEYNNNYYCASDSESSVFLLKKQCGGDPECSYWNASFDSILFENSGVYYGNSKSLLCANASKALTYEPKTGESASNYYLNCTFGEGENSCKHLFPYFPKKSVEVYLPKEDGTDRKFSLNDLNEVKTGDGHFDLSEKIFWGADPTKSKTNGVYVDESAIMGRGVDTFKWAYQEGDKVGVAVEGETNFSTQHIDNENKIMWAFSNNKCSKLSTAGNDFPISNSSNGNSRSYYIVKEGSQEIRVLRAAFDLNDCLEENLLEPNSNGYYDMKVDLVATPENPINDPEGNGDIVQIVSSASQIISPQNALYKWSVQESMDGSNAPGDSTNWKDITNQITSLNQAQIEGLGNSELSFPLNFSEDFLKRNTNESKATSGVYYFRVKLKVTESAGAASKDGEGQVIIKIIQQKNKITVRPIKVGADGMIVIDTASGAVSPCELSEKSGYQYCSVVKNDIIGVEVTGAEKATLSNFKWTINGNNYYCDSSISPDCTVANGNKLFFPILGNEGELVSVKADAVNQTGEHIVLIKKFKIIKPQVTIVSSDTSLVWPKTNGYYKDADGNLIADYSRTDFMSTSGYAIKLMAVFYPSSKESQADYRWTVDGIEMSDFSNKKELEFLAGEPNGGTYTVTLNAKYNPGSGTETKNFRKALLKNWNIAAADIIESDDSYSIDIALAQDPRKITPENSDIPWGASIISHLPENALFTLKAVLSSFLILFVFGASLTFVRLKFADNLE